MFCRLIIYVTLEHGILWSTCVLQTNFHWLAQWKVQQLPHRSVTLPFNFNTGHLHRDPMTRVNKYKRKADNLDFPLFFSIFYGCTYQRGGARGSVVGWDTALQVGRSQVRFPMVSLEFFIDIILPAALWPWSWLSL
jgi:hypothetical protein